MIPLENVNCVTGCLRHELDENSDYLKELIEMEEDDWKELDAQKLKILIATVVQFEKDFQIFKRNCGRCDNFKLNGKPKEYAGILDKAQQAITRILAFGSKVSESKEEGNHVAQTK